MPTIDDIADNWSGIESENLINKEQKYINDFQVLLSLNPTEIEIEDYIKTHFSSPINPNHYQDIIPGYQYIQLMEHLLGYEGTKSHLMGQIYKYMMRFGKKDSDIQEAGKIAWYSHYLADMIKRNENGKFPYQVGDPTNLYRG